jgi:CheY-like chemotaxis protein
MRRPKYRLLVVDDNEAVRDLIINILSREGHHCLSAADGNDALDKASENNFDAVITDIRMPGMDGITLTKELSKRYDTLPIMILTGYDDQYSAETAIAAGAQEFVKKPFSVDEFLLRFQMMMGDHEALSTLEARKNEIIFRTHTEFTEKFEGLERQIGKDRANLTSKYAPF